MFNLGTILVIAAAALFAYRFFKERDLRDLALCLFALSFTLVGIALR